ncbi:hypothetical protein ACQP3C_31300, partial [Escherichia coli]
QTFFMVPCIILEILSVLESRKQRIVIIRKQRGRGVYLLDTFLGKMDSETNVHEKFTFQDLI